MADDICPDCYGSLDVVSEDSDPANPRPMWDVKCEKCGKIFLRGDIERESEMIFPKWKFEKLDLAAIEKSLYDDEENN
jgi:hypothetical protein